MDTTEQGSDAFTQLEEDHLPDKRNSTGDALDEEQCALLVILSRARHGVIPQVQHPGRPVRPYPAAPSRWWSMLAASATVNRQALDQHMNAIYPLANA